MNSVDGMNSFGPQMLMEYGGCSTCGKGGAKRKLTPYNKFVKKEYKVLKAQYPAMTAPEIMKLIGKKWSETKK
jgi:hypothetical protein